MKMKKDRFHGSGYVRMILADPSECVDSKSILPTLRKYLTPMEEKPYGGNILMYALKDISHHFLDDSERSRSILNHLFEQEDEYLKSNQSDFYFGVYQKN